jgi:FTR1 family protein
MWRHAPRLACTTRLAPAQRAAAHAPARAPQAKSVVFEADDQHNFEGCVSIVASAFVTMVAFAMLRMYSMQKKWEQRLDKSITSLEMTGRNRYALFILAFSAVFREGVETVLLITGISRGNPESLPIPGLLGIFIGVIFGYFVAFGSRPINLK